MLPAGGGFGGDFAPDGAGPAAPLGVHAPKALPSPRVFGEANNGADFGGKGWIRSDLAWAWIGVEVRGWFPFGCPQQPRVQNAVNSI